MPRDYSRKLRVAVELQRLLNELLYAEINDPRLAGVTVTAVDLGADLSAAKVYFAMLDPDGDPAAAEAAFGKAASYLRYRIGRSVHLRRVPELRFLHDESARHGAEIGRMLDAANARDAGGEDPVADTDDAGGTDDAGARGDVDATRRERNGRR